MKFKRKKTERGFQYIEFLDENDYNCSLQESSLATEYGIWLGRNFSRDGGPSLRMHLTQSHAKELIKHLQKFVDTGHL